MTLSSENSCISDVIPLVRALNKIHDEIQESLNISVPFVLAFLSGLKDELDYHFPGIDGNMLFKVATLLDPRYKNKFFSDILVKQIKEKLRADLETEENITATSSSGVEPIILWKEHMLDNDDDDEKSENQISDTCRINVRKRNYQEISTN
ncbi:hypothetical protein HHI36_006129 [Cryptolaemus montrouzieri]|uniref:Uncharacterized protein n=1 Tax=Cryptolaemus montrouzieri TaxID=559131 RepID=A0ABD2NX94_9CUCU